MLKHREEERNESVLFGGEKSCIKRSQTAGLEGNHCGTQQQRCCGQFISFTCLHNLYIHDTQSFLYRWLRERYYRKSNCSIGCETIVIIQIFSGGGGGYGQASLEEKKICIQSKGCKQDFGIK